MIKIDEFRGYLAIDKYALDDEVVRQPSLFFEVSEAYASAAADRDSIKEQLAAIDARLDTDVRAKHEIANDKVTNPQVAAEIQTDPRHINAHDQWLAAKEQADILGALKDAFQQRSYMLRDLVSLHSANYFEESSLRSTASQDRIVYENMRAKMAKAREAKK